MKTSSAKAKGRRLQNLVRDLILATFPIAPWDVKTAIMGETGVDIHLSEEARKHFDFDVECKNVERLNVWSAWNQASSKKTARPLLVIKRNKEDPLAVVKLSDLFKILYEANKYENTR